MKEHAITIVRSEERDGRPVFTIEVDPVKYSKAILDLDELDQQLLRQCEASNIVSDKILALEIISVKMEENEKADEKLSTTEKTK